MHSNVPQLRFLTKIYQFLLLRDSREHRQNAGQCYNHEDKKDTQSNENETRQFTDSYHVLAQDGLLSYHGPRYHRQDIWSEKPVVTPETPRPGVSIKWSFRLIKRWNKYPTTRADTWHDFPLRLVLRTRGQQSIPARLINAYSVPEDLDRLIWSRQLEWPRLSTASPMQVNSGANQR